MAVDDTFSLTGVRAYRISTFYRMRPAEFIHLPFTCTYVMRHSNHSVRAPPVKNLPVHLSFVLIACFVGGLTLTVTSSSHAQETDEPLEVTADDLANDDSATQLENTFKTLGVSPDSDTKDHIAPSWTDRVTGLFGASKEDDTAVGADSAPFEEEARTSATAPATETEPSVETDASVVITKDDAPPDDSDGPVDTVSDRSSSVSTPSREPVDMPSSTPTPAPATPMVEPVSLDAILAETMLTPHSQHEAFYARLDEQRRLAIALHSTLQAAEQIAVYGKASTQLLQDAPLDTIVATMIDDKERERTPSQEPVATSLSTPTVAVQPTVDEPGDDETTGFDLWQFVYIVRDARGQRIGWRHLINGERLTTYVGETTTFDGDTVKITGVANAARGRLLMLEINGEPHEIHVF